ncbi:MAG: hypothetical protein ACREV9_08660 [Burkholderiales bacterium]
MAAFKKDVQLFTDDGQAGKSLQSAARLGKGKELPAPGERITPIIEQQRLMMPRWSVQQAPSTLRREFVARVFLVPASRAGARRSRRGDAGSGLRGFRSRHLALASIRIRH